MKLFGQIRGDVRGIRPIAVDKISNLQIILEPEHAAVHDGIHYIVEDFVSIANGENASIIIETPASPVAHFVFECYALDGSVEFEFRETATATSDGTVLTPRNNNRISINNSSLVFRLNPVTITDGTTLLTRSRVGSGTNPTDRAGGNKQRDKEFVLKASTKYQIKMINTAGVANNVGWSINYYEYIPYN